MLDHISLLPPEFYIIKRTQSRNKKLLIIFASLLCITLMAFIILTIITSGIKAELQLVEERLADVQAKIEELKEYEEQQAEIELMEEILEETLGFNPGLSGIIMEIGKTVPEEVLLTKIQAKYGYEKERNEDGELLPGKASFQIQAALYGSPEILEYWAGQLQKIHRVLDAQYIYAPAPEPDNAGQTYQQVTMNIAIKIDEPYRYFGGDADE